ncbi:MAG: hypothetical protein ABH875_00245, partial [Candidatus Omnitrophota bacterium]
HMNTAKQRQLMLKFKLDFLFLKKIKMPSNSVITADVSGKSEYTIFSDMFYNFLKKSSRGLLRNRI